MSGIGQEPTPLRGALQMAAHGLRVIPLHHPIKTTASIEYAKCSCGNYPCGDGNKNVGKHPRIEGWKQKATTDRAIIVGWAQEYSGCNFGYVLGDNFIGIDGDGRGGLEQGEAELEQAGHKFSNTLTVQTGDGWHRLYALNGLQPAKLTLAPGIAGRTGAMYLVAPDSLHWSGVRYILTVDAAIALLDAWAAERLGNGHQEGTDEPLPDLSELPAAMELLERDEVPERARQLFFSSGEDHPSGEGRSGALWELESLCLEAGFTHAETLKVASESGPNKYGQDGRPVDDLWREVLKNAAQHGSTEDEADKSPFLTLSTVEEESVTWLWPRRIPSGKITIIEGDPGGAKSLLTLNIAAQVSTGGAIPHSDRPGELEGIPSHVLIISAEDDLGDTIKPRLRAAGADIGRVHTLPLKRDKRGHVVPLSIPEDLYRIERGAKQFNVGLIIIDPITAYLSEKINSHNDASIRRAMTPLKDVIERIGCACILIRHFNKSGDMKAMYRGGGSIAFSGAARAVYAVVPHPENEDLRVIGRTKNNLAPRTIKQPTYEVQGWSQDPEIPVIVWREIIEIDIDELLQQHDSRKDAPALAEAKRVIEQILEHGPVPAAKAEEHLEEAGISRRTWKRAKTGMGIRSRKVYKPGGFEIDYWEWYRP